MTGWLEQLVRNMGYGGLVFLMFLENICPPIPSEVIMPLAGYLSTRQPRQMNFAGAIIAGVAGALLGAVLLYYLGRVLHEDRIKRWTAKYGHWILLDTDDIEQAFDWFDRHGKVAVFFARLIPGVRSLISIPAGSCKMNLGVFLLYSLVGTTIWTGVLAFAGRILGQNYSDVSNVIQWATYAMGALFVGSVVWWIVKKRRKPQAG